MKKLISLLVTFSIFYYNHIVQNFLPILVSVDNGRNVYLQFTANEEMQKQLKFFKLLEFTTLKGSK